MNLLIRIIVMSVLSVLTACTPTIQQVQLPPEKSFHRGFSLVPPNEKGWVYTQRDHNTLVLSKYGSTPNETYIILTTTWGLPSLASQTEFIDIVKRKWAIGNDPSRFKIKMHIVRSYPGKGNYCARSHLIFEDLAAVKYGGEIHTMILEVISLTCRHPDNHNVAISVGYSYRHFKGHGDYALPEKAYNLFQEFEFTALK